MKSSSNTLRTIDELCAHALLPRDKLDALAEVAARYAVALTPAMADLIDRNDPDDPIARQFVPDARELEPKPEERADPIADDPFSPVEGVVHRYPDRVLLKIVNACAVYCRFCFRREMVGPGRGGLSAAALTAALDYIEPNHLFACSDCGMAPLSRQAAAGKLRALAAGAALVNQEL